MIAKNLDKYRDRERLEFLYGEWAALAIEPYRNRQRLFDIELEVGRIEGPKLCSDRGSAMSRAVMNRKDTR